MSEAPNAVEAAWRSARILNRLPDTPEHRRAFYEGVRCAFNAIMDAFFDSAGEPAALTKLSDDLTDFGRALNYAGWDKLEAGEP